MGLVIMLLFNKKFGASFFFIVLLGLGAKNILAMDEEGILRKNLSSFNKGASQYSMSDAQFNDIFKIIYMEDILQVSSGVPKTIGQITIDFGAEIRTGTGTIIGLDDKKQTVTVITAKHVVSDNGSRNDTNGIFEKIVFTMGQSALSKTNLDINYLAQFSETRSNRAKIFFHPTLDLACVIFPLQRFKSSNGIDISTIQDNILGINNKNVKKGGVRYIYHYPWGQELLRLNTGRVNQEKGAQIYYRAATLPGSSGGPVVMNEKLIGIHVSSGTPSQETVSYDSETLNVYEDNVYISLEGIHLDVFEEVKR